MHCRVHTDDSHKPFCTHEYFHNYHRSQSSQRQFSIVQGQNFTGAPSNQCHHHYVRNNLTQTKILCSQLGQVTASRAGLTQVMLNFRVYKRSKVMSVVSPHLKPEQQQFII